MVILWEHCKTKMKKIGPLERMLHCVKIDKYKKMTLYIITGILSVFSKFPPIVAKYQFLDHVKKKGLKRLSYSIFGLHDRFHVP